MNYLEPTATELQREAATTRRLLERVPEKALGWKPHEKSMTLGRLAGHIAELLGLFGAILGQDELDFSTGDYKPVVATSVNQLVEMFDNNVSKATDLLKSQSDEHLM